MNKICPFLFGKRYEPECMREECELFYGGTCAFLSLTKMFCANAHMHAQQEENEENGLQSEANMDDNVV